MKKIVYFFAAFAAISACSSDSNDSVSAMAPVASFSASMTTGTVPATINFSDTSTDGTSTITAWQWDFGDGSTSTAENPTYVYPVAGEFSVSLTVTSADGTDSAQDLSFIVVDPSSDFLEPSEITAFSIDGDTIEAVAKQVVVFFEEDVSQAQLDAAFVSAADAGGDLQSFDQDLLIAQLLVEAGSEIGVRDAVRLIDGVDTARLNRVIDVEEEFGPEDNAAGFEHWQDTRVYSSSAARDAKVSVPAVAGTAFAGNFWIDQIGAPAAWAALSEKTLVENSIGVVDTGLPADQDVLAESRVSRFDSNGTALTDDDNFGTDDALKQKTHGRDVSAFAAGFVEGDDATRVGVNSHSDLVSIDAQRTRTITTGGEESTTSITVDTDVYTGAKTAIDMGVDVVNISWGDLSKCDATQADRLASRQSWRRAYNGVVNYARQRDVNVVFSAGNNCEKNDDQLLPDADAIDADSWASHALIVAANDASSNDACFSRMGEAVDLAAPGEAVGFGDGREINGTSFAAPLVTGALGLLRSVNSTLSAPEARAILLNTVSKTLTPQTTAENLADCAGRAVPSETTWEGTTPTGILNLNRAVETALLASEINLETKPEVSLAKDATTTIQVEVTVPETGTPALDLVFLIDQSGSYGDDINTLQSQAGSIITDLNSRGIDIRYAVAGFSDFPISPYGSAASNDVPFNLLQDLTSDTDAVTTAIELLDQPLLSGRDSPESQYEALFQSATTVGYRDGALPLILLATDADFHDSDVDPAYPGTGRNATIAALKEANITVVGLQSGSSSAAESRLNELAMETNGAVFELDRSSSEIAQAIADALDGATAESDIRLEALAGANWVSSVTPEVVEDVVPGGTATFDVVLEGQRNSSVNELTYDVYLWARANETSLLSRVKQSIKVSE